MNEFAGNLCTASSSTMSSQTSIAAAVNAGGGISSTFKRLSDPWLHHRQSLQQNEENSMVDGQRRRSTGRYSLLDALDLEYALLRAAARGSVGPISLSGSVHKLTFTQSLAFPALARTITSKRRRHSIEQTHQRPLDPNESGLNLLAKFVTACVLVTISFLVFLVVYKFSTLWGLLLLNPPGNDTDSSDADNSSFIEMSSTSPFIRALSTSDGSSFNDNFNASIPFDFHYYQRALLRRKPALAEEFRRIFNITTITTQRP